MGVTIWEWATAVKGLIVLLFRRKWETLNSGLELNGMLSRSLEDSSNESYVDWRLLFKRSQRGTILTTGLENVSVIFGGGGRWLLSTSILRTYLKLNTGLISLAEISRQPILILTNGY